MNNAFSREEIRRLQKAAREKDKKHIVEWMTQYDRQTEEFIRKEYEQAYHDELMSSIDNFCLAVAYTARFSETTHLGKQRLPEFMEDLFVTIDMFRTGEFKPDDYKQELEQCGIHTDTYHYKPRDRKVITLCGSTRFKEDFLKKAEELTLDDWIVLMPGVFAHTDNIEITDEQKAKLDKLHLEKIRISDAIFVINKDNYIGSSTKNEIEYAKQNRKKIYYLEEETIDGNKAEM